MNNKKEECWICNLPFCQRSTNQHVHRSMDRVLPEKYGGKYTKGNIRYAHVICNNVRGHDIGFVDDEKRYDCTKRVIYICQICVSRCYKCQRPLATVVDYACDLDNIGKDKK
jgi:hypothetical protein